MSNTIPAGNGNDLTAHDLTGLAQRINAAHDAVEAAFRKGLDHARTAGKLLTQAKAECPHGSWLTWLAENVRCTPRTVQGYMRIAREWDSLTGANAKRISHLSLREALDLLAEPQTPAAAGPRVPMPAFRPGKYYCWSLDEGSTEGGASPIHVEAGPSDHPGFWHWAAIYPETEGGSWCDYIQKAMRLTDPQVWDIVTRKLPAGVVWQENESSKLLEIVADWRAEDFREMLEDPRAYQQQREELEQLLASSGH